MCVYWLCEITDRNYFFLKVVVFQIYLYEQLLSASSREEPNALHNGNCSAILCVCALVVCNSQWVTVAVHSAFWISTVSGYCAVCLLLVWRHLKLLPSRRELYVHQTSVHQFTAPLSLKPHTCLAVTCHIHFRQNDRDLLRATAVTRGWNGYRNKSRHRKLTLKKNIRPALLRVLEPSRFWSRSRCCTTAPSPPPMPSCLHQATDRTIWLSGLLCSALNDLRHRLYPINFTANQVHFHLFSYHQLKTRSLSSMLP